jgi:hypothetical protein
MQSFVSSRIVWAAASVFSPAKNGRVAQAAASRESRSGILRVVALPFRTNSDSAEITRERHASGAQARGSEAPGGRDFAAHARATDGPT